MNLLIVREDVPVAGDILPRDFGSDFLSYLVTSGPATPLDWTPDGGPSLCRPSRRGEARIRSTD